MNHFRNNISSAVTLRQCCRLPTLGRVQSICRNIFCFITCTNLYPSLIFFFLTFLSLSSPLLCSSLCEQINYTQLVDYETAADELQAGKLSSLTLIRLAECFNRRSSEQLSLAHIQHIYLLTAHLTARRIFEGNLGSLHLDRDLWGTGRPVTEQTRLSLCLRSDKMNKVERSEHFVTPPSIVSMIHVNSCPQFRLQQAFKRRSRLMGVRSKWGGQTGEQAGHRCFWTAFEGNIRSFNVTRRSCQGSSFHFTSATPRWDATTVRQQAIPK